MKIITFILAHLDKADKFFRVVAIAEKMVKALRDELGAKAPESSAPPTLGE